MLSWPNPDWEQIGYSENPDPSSPDHVIIREWWQRRDWRPDTPASAATKKEGN
jgi:hypothetical protein